MLNTVIRFRGTLSGDAYCPFYTVHLSFLEIQELCYTKNNNNF